MKTSLLTLLSMAVLCGCNNTPVQPAPDDLNGIYHWDFANLEKATDKDMQEAVQKLFTMSDGGAQRRGALKDLTRDELGVVGLSDAGVDPTDGAGMYLFNTFDCTVDKLEKILAAEDQKANFPNLYWDYSRSFTTDSIKYFARDMSVPVLAWTAHVGSDVLGAKYTTDLGGALRRIKGADETGDFVVTRTWMTTPAQFQVMDGDVTFTVDYHAGFYWERAPGRMFHAYAVWRQTTIKGLGLDTDQENGKNAILDRLFTHDENTAKLCSMM